MSYKVQQPAATAAHAQRYNRLEWGLCLGVTLLAVLLHLVKLLSAGGLWRDEAGGVGLATIPSWREMWQMLPRDAFPVLFPAVVRVWSAAGFGHTDFGLRVLGCGIGLSILGMLWWNARVLGLRKPFFSLGLLAVNATLVQWGDALRAYGLGIVFMLLTVGLVWRMILQPTFSRYAWASLAGLLSVQSLYQNAFLLAALCGGAAFVSLRHHRPRTALLSLAVGLPAALSLLPYAGPLRESQRWWGVAKVGFKPELAWNSLSAALDTPPVLGPWLWIGLFLLGSAVGFLSLERRVSRRGGVASDLPLFAAVSSILGAFGFFLFLWNAGLPSQSWYWLPVITFVGVFLDAALVKLASKLQPWRAVVFAGVVGVSVPATFVQVRRLQTNVDVIARSLSVRAGPQDLILVYPWYCGVTFNRYYSGKAAWLTLPPLADYRLHRYDLVKEKLAASEPIQPALERIQKTLSAGNNVWIAGELPAAPPGETAVPTLPPAPDGPLGWFDEPYTYVWGRQSLRLIQTWAKELTWVSTNHDGRVSRFEDLPVELATGSGLNPFPSTSAPR